MVSHAEETKQHKDDLLPLTSFFLMIMLILGLILFYFIHPQMYKYIENTNMWIKIQIHTIYSYNEYSVEGPMNLCIRLNEPNYSMNLINTPLPFSLTIFCERWLKIGKSSTHTNRLFS